MGDHHPNCRPRRPVPASNAQELRSYQMSKARLEAFSDGVLAVAITLLVLDLHVTPEQGSIPHQLVTHWTSYAAYVISFIVIGVIWINHHALLAQLAVVD